MFATSFNGAESGNDFGTMFHAHSFVDDVVGASFHGAFTFFAGLIGGWFGNFLSRLTFSFGSDISVVGVGSLNVRGSVDIVVIVCGDAFYPRRAINIVVSSYVAMPFTPEEPSLFGSIVLLAAVEGKVAAAIEKLLIEIPTSEDVLSLSSHRLQHQPMTILTQDFPLLK